MNFKETKPEERLHLVFAHVPGWVYKIFGDTILIGKAQAKGNTIFKPYLLFAHIHKTNPLHIHNIGTVHPFKAHRQDALHFV